VKPKTIGIIGGGPVGALLGIFLANLGYETDLFEQRDDIRVSMRRPGRSINLALSDRGIKSLDLAGVTAHVLQESVPMYGRAIHDIRGNTAQQPYGRQGQCIYSISRHRLNCRLLDLAEERGVRTHFRYRCQRIELPEGRIHFHEEGGKDIVVCPDLVFGVDGAQSTSRKFFTSQTAGAQVDQQYIDFEYKELSFPASPAILKELRTDSLHIWPRSKWMLIALPNPDNSFTGTLFLPASGPHSFGELGGEKSLSNFLAQTFPGLLELAPDAPHQLCTYPLSSLSTIKCGPWTNGSNFCLVGDAAHAILPFFGQGMNAGFEDCRVLHDLIREKEDDWPAILQCFEAQRKVDTDAIADLAYQNFFEMREKTADPRFLLQKKIEARLHEHHPDKWVPAYTQVTFRPDIRYSEALQNSLRQELIMQQVMAQPGIEALWNETAVEEMILSRL
jgi:kynurenine 3-monooxygenase